MEDKCRMCGKAIEQPKRGRRRKYDSASFRRLVEVLWTSDEEIQEAERVAKEPPKRQEVIDLGSDYGWFDI